MLSWQFKSSCLNNLFEKERKAWLVPEPENLWLMSLSRAVPVRWWRFVQQICLTLMKVWGNLMNISIKITQDTTKSRLARKVSIWDQLWLSIMVSYGCQFEFFLWVLNKVIEHLYVSDIKFLIWLSHAPGLGINEVCFLKEE